MFRDRPPDAETPHVSAAGRGARSAGDAAGRDRRGRSRPVPDSSVKCTRTCTRRSSSGSPDARRLCGRATPRTRAPASALSSPPSSSSSGGWPAWSRRRTRPARGSSPGPDAPGQGCFVSPSVVECPDGSLALWSEEIFGPVTATRSFIDEDALVEEINGWGVRPGRLGPRRARPRPAAAEGGDAGAVLAGEGAEAAPSGR
ncbi:aldehyde dehydrogenase family protein [Nonomuraea zeae]|uniref:Aldehyde dehydrogenase family protein n=1 Tax=Nonomuraea zeae TaxID=1642303 RepID=A0A5S4H3G8_9ACTN|nr:aldehyde dehydrogenase family protein [Nonomuraea zeae]